MSTCQDKLDALVLRTADLIQERDELLAVVRELYELRSTILNVTSPARLTSYGRVDRIEQVLEAAGAAIAKAESRSC